MIICAPAFIYLIFSLIQVFIDCFNGLIQMAGLKILIMIVVTFLLNLLCGAGLSFVSWVIVLMPFIFMAISVGILLYVFGANVIKGSTGVSGTSTYSSTPQTYSQTQPTPSCYTQKTQNWEVIRGNVVMLPSYSTETIC